MAVPAPLATKSPSFWSKVPLLVIVPAVWVRLDAPFQLSVTDLAAAIVIVPLVVQTDVAPLCRGSLTVSVPRLSKFPCRWLPALLVGAEVTVARLVSVPAETVTVAWVVLLLPSTRAPWVWMPWSGS